MNDQTATDRRLRIACVGACPYPVPQGSQVYLRETARQLHALGHEAHLVVYGYGRGQSDDDFTVHRTRNIPGVRRTSAGPFLAKPLLDAILVAKLRSVVRRNRIDVVDAHNYEALMVGLTARKRPIVYHAHNAMADELPYYMADKDTAATLGNWLDKRFPKRADLVVVPHEKLKDYLIECGADPERIRTIQPAVDCDVFEPATPERTDPAVLYAGNLDAYQNLDLLTPVMERVLDQQPGTQLVVATSDERYLEQARMVRIDSLDALKRELRRDVIFACPRVSWSGYPIKLLNAMAAGLPIVCCESSAHPLTHQYNGLIVPDNDAEAFAASLLRLMADPELRRKLGANARATAERNHHPDVVGVALDECLRELVSERNRAVKAS